MPSPLVSQVVPIAGLCSICSLLIYLPLTTRQDLDSCVMLSVSSSSSTCVSYKVYYCVITAVNGITSAWSILPLLVLATSVAPKTQKGMFYNVYLSFQDLGRIFPFNLSYSNFIFPSSGQSKCIERSGSVLSGGSIGAWITTPIVARLGITVADFGHRLDEKLSLLIFISAAARFLNAFA